MITTSTTDRTSVTITNVSIIMQMPIGSLQSRHELFNPTKNSDYVIQGFSKGMIFFMESFMLVNGQFANNIIINYQNSSSTMGTKLTHHMVATMHMGLLS